MKMVTPVSSGVVQDRQCSLRPPVCHSFILMKSPPDRPYGRFWIHLTLVMQHLQHAIYSSDMRKRQGTKIEMAMYLTWILLEIQVARL